MPGGVGGVAPRGVPLSRSLTQTGLPQFGIAVPYRPRLGSSHRQQDGGCATDAVTRGQYDVVLVLEMPDGDAMTKLAVGLTSRGNVRTTTVRPYLPEEFGKLAAELR
jgi:hypothetical protein